MSLNMKPNILDIIEKDGVLKFTINNINVSYANAIRRVVLSNIPTVVFRTFPHEKNDATFEFNTCKLNNEILKQRLSCIPIHIDDLEIPIEDYIMEVDVNNTSDTTKYVTTGDFKIKNIKTDKYLSDEQVNNIFPPDPISKEYIDFCRLRPKLSESIPGERLKMSCKFSIGTSKENGSFNVVSTCAYANSPDIIKIEEASIEKKIELETKYEKQEDIEHHLKDWSLLDAKRIFISDSFDFKVETVGVFDNKEIIKKAINILIDKLTKTIETYSMQNNFVLNSEATIPNCFDVIMENEDYTIGKILEYTLYNNYYRGSEILTYCGFNKPHPHINISIIRLGFKESIEKNAVLEYINNAAAIAIAYYKELLVEFGGISPDSLFEVKPKKIIKSIKNDDLSTTNVSKKI